jgi:hypothetical protein
MALAPEEVGMDWLTAAFAADAEVPLDTALVRLVAALGLGVGVSLVCRLGKGGVPTAQQRSLMATLVLLTLLLALTTIVIGSNVARAFSIVGALSIVRFRTVVADTRDTAFVICAVAVGMAAGAGYFVLPLAALPLVALAAWMFRGQLPATLSAGSTHKLSIVGAPQATSLEALQAVLVRHGATGILSEAASQARGASFERVFDVTLLEGAAAQGLVQELVALDGVESVQFRQA